MRLLSRRLLALRASSVVDPSLSDGQAGLALAHSALEFAYPGQEHAAHAERALDRSLDALATTAMSPGLFAGFAGVAWTFELLQGDPAAPLEEDPSTAIDAALERYLTKGERWTEPYDLIAGLVGLGVYALERLGRPSAKRVLALVVKRLAETARRRTPGVAWRSDPEWVPPKFRGTFRWNLGVAHGVPGVIALLGRTAAADVDASTKKKARVLLDKAVAWLLAQELPRDARACSPYAITPRSRPHQPARLAWCYGDPGITATLLVAARAVREPAWERAAMRIARRAAARPAETSGGADARLCHGAAGVAHIFHRMFLATGDKQLAGASRFWFARTLAMRSPRGFAGFRAWAPDDKGKLEWQPQAGFLTGAAGVGLALVAATTDADPIWDRALLLS